MKNYLMVPVQLDALVIESQSETVVQQAADFHRQSHYEPALSQGFNSDSPNISEYITSKAFQNKRLVLGKGVHLHWALPDALTRGEQGLKFPEVPNRWLITRRKKSSSITQNWEIEKQWVVESDYLYPPGIDKVSSAVSIPYDSNYWCFDNNSRTFKYKQFEYSVSSFPQSIQSDSSLLNTLFDDVNQGSLRLKPVSFEQINQELAHHEQSDVESFFAVLRQPIDSQSRSNQPYRYMGRKMPLSSWQETFDKAEYYPSLTSIGYGEPTFAAFYPNCFSVFGFHDQSPNADLSNTRYEVTGWYSDPHSDELYKAIKNTAPEEVNETIKSKFNWENKSPDNPTHLLCFGGLEFNPKDTSDQDDKKEVSLCIANTETEALSARVAHALLESGSNSSESLKTLEDQLEAAQLNFRLEEKKLDVMARFRELRHELGFKPSSGGYEWQLKTEQSTTNEASPSVREISEAELNEINQNLNELNALQYEYDKSWRELENLRKQLFADWYKYIVSCYPGDESIDYHPDADLLKFYLESSAMPCIKQKRNYVGTLNADNTVTPDSPTNSVAVKLSQKLTFIRSKLQQKIAGVRYRLEKITVHRFWEPNDPVILMDGDSVKQGKRHGQDGMLECQIFTSSNDKPFVAERDFNLLSNKVHECMNNSDSHLKIWQSQPWNPLALEWQVELYPTLSNSNLHQNKGLYSTGFITDNYQARVNDPDLSLKKNKGKLARIGHIYSGTSLLTAHANSSVKSDIEYNLITKRRLVYEYQRDNDITSDLTDSAYLQVNHAKIKAWYKESYLINEHQPYSDPVYTLLSAYNYILDTPILAQSLGGFNQALQMHKNTLELPVEDPCGFEQYRQFSDLQVSNAISDSLTMAPSPLNVFNPIRTGCLKLLQLRLVDSFGQVKDLNCERVLSSYKMTSPGSKHLIKLPPRLAQPARLNLNWLDASHDKKPLQNTTHNTPVCGWLLVNKHDQSLMFYNAEGHALGYFKAGSWRQAIDSDAAKNWTDISNSHLRRVAKFIADALEQDIDNSSGHDFLTHFNNTLLDALDNIHAEKHTAVQGAAVLIGRPIAVVRASLNLELASQPAINQDWNTFRRDIGKQRRTSDGFDKVNFPVRMGESGQLNDGLVGYWLEDTDYTDVIHFESEQLSRDGDVDNAHYPVFYSPQSNEQVPDHRPDPHIKTHADEEINFYQSLSDSAQMMTLLMDVQGSLHATVGVLPNKEIRIPEECYREALENLEVSFLHAPVLTAQGQYEMPLRPVKDHAWSWVERKSEETEQWLEVFPQARISKQTFITAFLDLAPSETHQKVADLWNYLLSSQVKWLKSINESASSAQVMNKDDRELKVDDKSEIHFSSDFKGLEGMVEHVLDLYAVGINSVNPDLHFNSPQSLIEGWQKLRKASSDNN